MAVAERETIELLVESPVVRHPGLNEAIRLLERVDALTGRRHKLHIDVTGNLSGLEALGKVADMHKALRAEARATNVAAKAQEISLKQVGEKMNALHLLAAQLAEVEARLVRPVNQATAALDAQTDIAKRKAVAMGQLARATGQVGDAERRNVRGAAPGGAAAPGGRGGVLSSTRTGDGLLTVRTLSVGEGVKRRERYTPNGVVTSIEDSRIARAQAELKGLVSTGRQQADVLKAQGAPAADLVRHYQNVASSVDKLHGSYRDIAPALKADAVAQQLRLNATKLEAAATRKAAEDRERVYSREAAADAKRATMQGRVMRDRAEAARIAHDFDLQGFAQDPSSRRVVHTPKGRKETMSFTRDVDGFKETAAVMMQYDRAGNLVAATSNRSAKALKEQSHSAQLASGGLLATTAAMAKFAAGGAVIYGTLGLIRKGFESFTDIERRTAILQQVFRGTLEDANALRDGVLSLAAANGRSSTEAIDAATRFSRLGLTRVEVLEATAVALKAANVAEIDTATAAEQLSAVYAAYSLRVEDLNTVLNQLNTISNTYNVTNKDLLNGLARTAALGRQAGIGLTELLGVIGSGVGRTGRPGAEFGNAIKSIIVALSNPKLQGVLKTSFDIDVKDQMGEIKSFSEILRELFIRYQDLNNAERQALVTRVANKQQASRLTALLDGYVQSQVLAIRANTDLTSAERENAKVRATLAAQIQGLITQYEALSGALAGSNTGSGFNTTLTTLVEFLRNLLALMTASSDVVAIVIAVLGLLAVRVGLVAIKTAAASKEQNFFASSCAGTTQALRTLRGALGQVVMGYQGVSVAARNAAAAQSVGAGAGRRVVSARRGPAGGVGRGGGGSKIGGLFKNIIGSTLIGSAVGSVIPGLGTAAGGAAGLTRGVVVGLGRLAATIAIDIAAFKAIEGTISGVNRAFEANATSAEKANRALSGLDQQLEETKANAEAFRLGGRLAGTLEKLVVSPRQDPRFVSEQLQIGAEAFTANPAEREKLAQLYREGRIMEVVSKLKEYGAIQTEREVKAKREAILLTDRQVQATRLALAMREETVKQSGKDPATDDEAQTLRRTLSEIEGRRMTLQVDMDVDEGQLTESAEKVAEAFKTQIEQRLSLLAGVFENLGSTDRQKANLGVASLRAQLRLLQKDREEAETTSATQIKGAGDRTAGEEASVRGSGTFQAMLERARGEVAKAEKRLATEKEFASGNPFAQGRPLVTGRDLAAIGKVIFPFPSMIMSHTGNKKQYEAEREFLFGPRHVSAPRKVGGEPVARAQIASELAAQELRDLELLSPNATQGVGLFDPLEKARAAQQKIVEASEKDLQLTKEKLGPLQKQKEELLRIAEAELALVGYEEAKAKGRSQAGLVGLAARGDNETERLIDESRRLSGPIAERHHITGDPLSSAAAKEDLDKARATGDVKGELQAIAALQAMGANAGQLQNQTLQRHLILNREIETSLKRQNEARSEALLTGSRQEQLQAAAAAKFSKQRGGKGFTAQEFMFLDQGTRQGLSKTNPELLPPEMFTELQKLSAEYQASEVQLNRFKGELGGSIEALIQFTANLTPSNVAQDEVDKKAKDALNGHNQEALQQSIRDAGNGVVSEVSRLSATYVSTLNDVKSSLSSAIEDVKSQVSDLKSNGRGAPGGAQRTG